MKRILLGLVFVLGVVISSFSINSATTLCENDEHDWKAWKVVSKVTCTYDGYRIRHCRKCKLVQEEVIKAEGHQYKSKWKKITKKNLPCADMKVLKDGTFTTCKKCKDIKVKNKDGKEIKKDSNAFNHISATTTKTLRTPNCNGIGVKIKRCKKCCNIQKEITSKKKTHKYEKAFILYHKTCGEDGAYAKDCTSCGKQKVLKPGNKELTKTQTEKIKSKGHSLGHWIKTKDATCTVNASYEQRCNTCGEVINRGTGGETKTWVDSSGNTHEQKLDGVAEGHKYVSVRKDDDTVGEMCRKCGVFK